MDRTTRGAPPPAPASGGVEAAPDARGHAPPDARMPRRGLGWAQVAWVVTAVLAPEVLLASVPGYVPVARHGEFAGRRSRRWAASNSSRPTTG